MKAVQELISVLRKKDVWIRVENNELRISAPKGALNDTEIARIREERAAIIELLGAVSTAAKAPPVMPRKPDAYLSLSFSQQRLWFIDKLEGGSAAYHLSRAVRLQGVLDRGALVSALDTVLERHEALRTVFASVDNGAVQVVTEAQGFALRVEDLRAYSQESREEQVRQHAAEETRTLFDLSVGPLIRGRLLQVSEHEHVLLVTMHHIVSDGWSMGILIREVAALYAAYRSGQPNPLAPLPIQYADYAVWQREWLQGEVLQNQVQYWQQQLAGIPALVELPTDYPRPALQSYRGNNIQFVLSAELSAQLRKLCQQQDVTLFMTIYAAFAILLSRLSGQQDIVIGTPVANRQRTEVEGLIGLFVNTLALRVQLQDDPTVKELLKHVRAMTLSGYSHQDVPFEQVVEVLQPARSLSHSPVFQVLLTLQNTPQGEFTLPGLTLAPQARANTTAQFDLTLSLQEDGERIVGGLNYTSDLFSAATIERWAGHLQAILTAMVQGSEQRVSAIELLSNNERRQLLSEFNATATDYPSDQLIHELFEAQVEKSPDAIAVCFEDRQLTYRELNGKANQLARYLRSRGVGPDQLVAICVERSVEMVIALLGVLKSGGAYVPVDPSYPAERVAYMLADAAPRVLLTQERLKSGLPASTAELITLDEGWREIAQHSEHNLIASDVGVTSRHLAYVIYTSGSTGQPKGVMVTQGNGVNFLKSMQARPGIAATDRVLAVTTLSFDIAGLEIYLPLTSGAQVIVAGREAAADPMQLMALLEQHAISLVQATPATWRMLLSAGWAGRPTLKVLCGGEALSGELARQLGSRVAELWNLYGPTETTIWSCCREVTAAASARAIEAIGRPIANTQIYILDSQRQPVPLGVIGEIYIGGAGVARGYLNRPELTAERFIPDPFSSERNARLYKTGDLGRYAAEGDIEYVGRNDHQVKVRGFRIELGEIESQLVQHANVKEAVVVAREAMGEVRLVAYLTSREASAGHDELRAHLRSRLPEYMIPSVYVHLEQLPLTPNGKVDRKALPAPDMSALSNRRYEAPEGEIEAALSMIWQELLHVERVGRHDNFFELGGHSLLAVQLMTRIRQGLGRPLELREIFEHPTLQALAKEIIAADTIVIAKITRADRNQPPTLSFSQQRLWFIDKLEGGSAAYHLSRAVRLQGVLDRGALVSALDTVLERHEALRTVFASVDNGAVQVVTEAQGFALRVEDLRAYSQESREEQVRQHAAEETRTLFDLSVGPLIRGRLLQVSEHEHVLLVTMHHIVSDGWSMGILIREVAALYAAYRSGQPNPLAPLPIQYADYAVWQREWLQGEVLQNQVQYWQQQLAGIPALVELPTDYPRPALQSYRGNNIQFVLSAELSAQLRKLCQQQDVTLFMTIYAAFAILLSRLSGQQDIVIGTPVANRQRTEVEGLIGLFVNTLALRVQLQDDPTVKELLKHVRAMTLSGYSHQDVPFEQVVEVLQPARSLSHSPVFQVLLTLQNTPQGEFTLPGLTLAPQARANTTAQFDLTLSLQEDGERIVGGLNYTSDLFSAATIERWAGHLQAILTAMVQGSEQRVSAIELLSNNERRQLLSEFNATATDYPSDQLIHELFEAQVEKSPDAIAVCFEDRQLTYRELNGKANQLARYLRSRGVGPDQLVAICVERSVEMVIALLGVLKSGGAYVPVDPSYPAERVAYMLADAAPRVLLTQERLKSGLPASTAELITLDEGWREIAQHSEHNLIASDVGVTSRHLAYVIYTSGSTGQPKGVMVTQGNGVNFLKSMQARPGIAATDRVLAVTTLSFDIAGLEIYLPLTSGAQVIVAGREAAADPMQLMALLEQHAISLVQATPATWRMLLSAGWAGRPTLKVLCGGEALSGELARQLGSRVAELWNLYGPTETTIWSCCREVTAAASARAIEAIGRPIANTQIYILDSQRQPVPLGVIGEIYIGGAGVARGYLNRPELTAERFIPDPFSSERNARLYKTGDLGRYAAEGDIEYVGRNDHQVKVRGFRIELGEIESQLVQHANVKEAVVVAREAMGEVRLVAYLTSREASAGHDELRAHLRSRLPEYMIPSVYVHLEQLPLTPNGKVDRKALPAPDMSALSNRRYEAPEGEIEAALSMIWQELLHVERVGRHDNFFELGGHSLLAVQLMTRIRQGLDVEVSLQELFEHVTVQSLGECLAVKDWARKSASLQIAEAEEGERETISL